MRLAVVHLMYVASLTSRPVIEPEGTQRVQTHAVLPLTLTLTFDLSTQNHTTCRISQGHSLYTKFEHFGIIYLSYAPGIRVKNAYIDPVTLTFDL